MPLETTSSTRATCERRKASTARHRGRATTPGRSPASSRPAPDLARAQVQLVAQVLDERVRSSGQQQDRQQRQGRHQARADPRGPAGQRHGGRTPVRRCTGRGRRPGAPARRPRLSLSRPALSGRSPAAGSPAAGSPAGRSRADRRGRQGRSPAEPVPGRALRRRSPAAGRGCHPAAGLGCQPPPGWGRGERGGGTARSPAATASVAVVASGARARDFSAARSGLGRGLAVEPVARRSRPQHPDRDRQQHGHDARRSAW